jgi:hypothetical protein
MNGGLLIDDIRRDSQMAQSVNNCEHVPMMAGNNNSYTLPRMRRDPTSKPTVRIVENQPQRRPLSLYDNLQQRGGGSGSISSTAVSVGNLAESAAPPTAMDRSPSQANCLSTTVPQNIAATNIAGRHTPTRNSLRHSRMIVLSRKGGKGTFVYGVKVEWLECFRGYLCYLLFGVVFHAAC